VALPAQDAGVDGEPTDSNPTLDTQAPAVSIDSGPTGPTSDPRPTFGFASSDASATLACSIDTGVTSFGPCSGTDTHQPASSLADGSYWFRVKATDPAGNSTTATRAFTVDTQAPSLSLDSGPTDDVNDPGRNPTTTTSTFGAESANPPSEGRPKLKDGSNAPGSVPAWYMTARSVGDLRRQARYDACAFARRQGNRTRVLLLDFGKADKHKGVFGAQLRTGPHFSNSDILGAMKAGARRYRSSGPCYSRGSVRITYGNTNNMPNEMGHRAVRRAGHLQARTAHRLARYQRRRGFDYRHEGVAVAGDIEPQWNRPGITKDLVHGATARGRGGLYFNYGSATNCPPERSSCDNHWDFGDLGHVSFGRVKRPLPEIYRPVHAKQWTHVRRRWNNNHRSTYCFFGATATPGFPLSTDESWERLDAQNPCVGRELVNIRDN